jgi:aspartyl-tRNA(Asn)/glutamyl-tRNA(Gln) amidotransferase subunit B
MNRQPTIGLEIHAILKTRTKMFCDSPNVPDEKEPNRNVCPVCLGHPGALPVINEEAVRQVVRVGLALGGKANPVSKFDRKNYFYPDLPKGYQISQYDQPLVEGGELCGVRIRRIHLEEDAGRLLHEIPGEAKKGEASYVDFNRAGVPLMELVTEPDVRSAEQALEFARELQRILRYLGASDADMEKGQMRVEANVSLDMGVKTELKNINSFRAVNSAVAYEIARQNEALDRGEAITQETRGWNETKQQTFSQRSKEEAHDYRYFPEPDLPPFETSIFDLDHLRNTVPELPAAKRERFAREFGLSAEKAAQLAENKEWAEFFEEAVSEIATRDELSTSAIEKKPRELLYNYFMSDLLGLLNERAILFSDSKVTPDHLAHLVDLIADGKIMSRQAKDILARMVETGSDPEEIMRDEGLETVSDEGEIAETVRAVIAENPAAVADFQKGKTASLQFMLGKAMGKLRGRANPARLKELFERELG